MYDPDFDSSNKLTWSNEFLDFILSSNLLLKIYSDRPEADVFRQEIFELYDSFKDQAKQIPSLIVELMKNFPMNRFGASREASIETLNDFIHALLPFGIASGLRMISNPLVQDIIRDDQFRDVFLGLGEFVRIYRDDYARKRLGGTWLPEKSNIFKSCLQTIKGIRASKVMAHQVVIPLLQYLSDVIHICYNSGLKCWWAPLFLFNKEASKITGHIAAPELVMPTADGLFGFIFPRKINKNARDTEEKKPFIEKVYDEITLITTPNDEIRIRQGDFSEAECEKLKDWGYYYNHRKRERDFNMLFDKLYLGLSNTEIASRYPWEDDEVKATLHKNTVQRITSKLSDLLWIELPRAKKYYKTSK